MSIIQIILLGVSIGPTSSDDGDYNQFKETFTLATKALLSHQLT